MSENKEEAALYLFPPSPFHLFLLPLLGLTLVCGYAHRAPALQPVLLK